MKKLFFLLALSPLLSNCGGDDSSSTPEATENARCTLQGPYTSDSKIYSMCHDFKSWTTSSLAQAKTDCESSSGLGGTGTYEGNQAETGGCSTIGKLGTCSWSTGSATVSTLYSASEGGITATEAEALCTSTWSGTWSTN